MFAFDLIELDGADLRREPLEVRKATLANLLARASSGLRFNEHMDNEDGPLVFAHACRMGLGTPQGAFRRTLGLKSTVSPILNL
jgi:ATP-dependent DNA ligase